MTRPKMCLVRTCTKCTKHWVICSKSLKNQGNTYLISKSHCTSRPRKCQLTNNFLAFSRNYAFFVVQSAIYFSEKFYAKGFFKKKTHFWFWFVHIPVPFRHFFPIAPDHTAFPFAAFRCPFFLLLMYLRHHTHSTVCPPCIYIYVRNCRAIPA